MSSYEIEHFKSQVDIVDVIGGDCALSPDGSRLCGAHCKHSSKSGKSLKVYPDQQSFYCFNCHAGGDVISYVMNRDGSSFIEAMKWLSGKFNIPLPNWTPEEQAKFEKRQSEKEVISNILHDAFRIYHDEMSESHQNYFRGRGLIDETIDNELLGYAPNDDTFLVSHLKDKYDSKELLLSGLFVKVSGGIKDAYQRRYLIPYWHQKKIVYSIGRLDTDDPEEIEQLPKWNRGKYKKHLTRSDKFPYVSETIENVIYNADCVRSFEEGVITEGIIDSLLAKQAGFGVISPVTVRFKKHDIEELCKLAKHWKTVYIINDSEITKRGEEGALQTAEALFQDGQDVRLVTLPLPEGTDKIDLADYLNVSADEKENRIEELKQLMAEAPDFIEWKIDEVAKLSEREQRKEIKPILEKLVALTPVEQGYYTGIIAKNLSINKGDITDTLKTLSKKEQSAQTETTTEQKEPTIVQSDKPIGLDFSLAQDFVDDTLSYCIYLPMDFDGHVQLMPHLITSNREAILITQETLAKKDIYLEKLVPPSNMNRWAVDTNTDYNVHQFLESGSISSVEVYKDLHQTLKRFLWHPDDSLHIILSLWTMESYVFMLFDSVGYLSATATKRAAKTRILELLEELAFNAMLLSGQSEAYTYRKIENDRVTLLLDEADRLAKQSKFGNTLLEQLRSGYKRTGKTGLCEGESHRPTEFSTYSMKAFANVEGIEEMLSDRVIILNPERKPIDVKVDRLLMYREKGHFQLLRNKLYTWALCHAKQIHDAYTNMEIPGVYYDYISDREEEIWAGLLAVAKVIDSEANAGLFELALNVAKVNKQRKIAEEATGSLDSQFLEGLLDYLNNGNPKPIIEAVDGKERKYYPKWEMEYHLADFFGWSHITSQKFISDYLTRLRILENVREPNAIRKVVNAPIKDRDGGFKRDPGGAFIMESKRMVHYWLDEIRIKDVAKRYDILMK